LHPPTARAQSLALAEARTSDDYDSAIRASRELIRGVMDQAGLPGVSIAVGVGDEIVWSEGVGWADLEQRAPVTTLTKFRIGSVSKTMTASGLGLLVERGLVDLDAPIQTYVPNFPEKRWPITTRQVGGHTAGFRHYVDDEFLSDVRYPTVDSGLAIFADDTLLHEPGAAMSYSTYGYTLVSAVIEDASGVDFLAFMRDEVFEPLGLRHTVADYNDSIIAYRTSFYERDAQGRIVNAPHVDSSYKWAGGGFLSTPEDMVRFGLQHLRGGFLDPATLALLQTSQIMMSGEPTQYGLGWFIGEDRHGDRTYFHSGGSMGGTTLLLLVPDRELVVAGVANIDGPVPNMVEDVAAIFEDRLMLAH
jgi:CubicO group peptidase (beta-lactamase class C family)